MNESLIEITISENRQMLSHTHEQLEFFYMVDGEMKCTIEDDTFDVIKDDFFIVPSGRAHSCVAAKNVLYLMLRPNHSMVQRYFDPALIGCNVRQSREDRAENKKTRRLLRKLMNFYLSEDPMDELLLQATCCEWLYHLAYFYKTNAAAMDSPEQLRKRQIQKFIEEKYFYPIKLADLADAMHFSTVYMSRHFKKLFGVNFLEYLNQFRVRRAREMLLQNMNRSVAQVAMDCGFPNLAAFYKSFHALVGTSPTGYRSEMTDLSLQNASDQENAKNALKNYLGLGTSPEDEAPGRRRIFCSVSDHGQTYDKCWSKVINIGEISNMARSDFQKHILFLKQELGFLYVRIWNIHSPDLQIVKYQSAQLTFDFSRLDRILDFLVENGLHIYLDLGNKPLRLLRGENDILSEERHPQLLPEVHDYEHLIGHLIRHLCRRYGSDEVSQWYFEYWFDYENPDKNSRQSYEAQFCRIYEIIKKYAPKAKVGGIGDMPEPLYDMPEVMRRQDFVSIYSYPNDYPKDGTARLKPPARGQHRAGGEIPFGTHISSAKKFSFNPVFSRDDYLEYQCSQLSRLTAPASDASLPASAEPLAPAQDTKLPGAPMPLTAADANLPDSTISPPAPPERHISEWGFSVSNRNLLNDSIFKAAYIVKNCINVIGQVDVLAYWMGTDLFAEYNDTQNMLFGGTGLLTRHMLLKPAYYAFSFLNQMGGRLLTRTDNAMITMDAERDYKILCHNYKKPGPQYFQTPEEAITPENYTDFLEDLEPEAMSIRLNDLENGEYQVKSYIINEHYGNLIGLWKEMGYPNELTFNDVSYLQKRCIPQQNTNPAAVEDHCLALEFEMEPNEIRLIHIYPAQ